MITTALEYARVNRLVSSIYHDCADTDSHLTGYIVAADDTCCVVAHISTHGLYDGYIAIPTEHIYRIDYSGIYENRIKRLYEIKQQSHKAILCTADLDTSLRLQLLSFAKESHLVVSLVFDESTLSGFIAEANEENVLLSLLDSIGNNIGFSSVQLDTVGAIAVDTDDEQDLMLLNTSAMVIK